MNWWQKEKPEARQIFGIAMTTIYLGGFVLYFAGVKPKAGFSSQVIPVNEPAAIDWIAVAGLLFLA